MIHTRSEHRPVIRRKGKVRPQTLEVGRQVLAEITRIFADLSISIDAMVQKEPHEGEDQVDIILLTHLTVEKHVNAAIAKIERLPVVIGKVTRIRLEELN